MEPAHARLRALFDAEGLPHNIPQTLFNSRLAQELGKWGDAQGKPELHDALFRANFVDAANLAEIDVLVRAAQSVGLPGDEARAVLSERRFEREVDQDWHRARALGVTGVPTFVIGDAGFSGAQPYEVLEQFAVEMGATKRATERGRQ
jgi:predicted DsbA family dithiol-disulfide isomerase